MSPTSFCLPKLLQDVFAPAPYEKVVVMFDEPHGDYSDNRDWQDRRKMAEQWRRAWLDFPVFVMPPVTFPATGGNNADLPATVRMGDDEVGLADLLEDTNILLAFTRFSATAPLSAYVKRMPHLRAASLPGVLKRMEKTALAADYKQVARRVAGLADRLNRSHTAHVVFSTGDEFQFDLRHRRGLADDGRCHADDPHRLINLPSGEAFIVPYEGEIDEEPSRTEGRIPVTEDGEAMVWRVGKNRITDIEGTGPVADRVRARFDLDPARRNIAELGLGCNDRAIVAGSVLEDEKAGFHWAYGRSEHLGGTVGPDAFRDPSHVVHQDIVYAAGCPHTILSLNLSGDHGYTERLIQDGKYTV